MYQIIVDGQVWIDSDGLDCWPQFETEALAELLDSQGYDVDVIQV